MSSPQVSIVIPCLNEARSVGACVRRAVEALREGQLNGEVIVADNGSSDASRELAVAAGARVVPVAARGYGSALMAGITAAEGEYIIMGDADGSYDFGAIPQFVARLREGFDLVQGCRFPTGGGTIAPGAMPVLHQWFGNPVLSALARLMFPTPLHDVYCGLRGFTKSGYKSLNLRCTGMEFATEMIVKAAQRGLRTSEVPITLHRDGREGAPSHLRTFRDGWRTLRLFLLCSPRWLFFIPGIFLLLGGLVLGGMALTGVHLGRATLDVHTLLVSSLLAIVGVQSIYLSLFARTFAVVEGLQPPSEALTRFYRFFSLEKALVLSALTGLLGVALIGKVGLEWRAAGYGPLVYAQTLRWVIPGVTLIALSAQAIFSSFMISLLGLERK